MTSSGARGPLLFSLDQPPSGDAGIWRASDLATTGCKVRSTGWPGLDPHLPDGGWPSAALTELLLGDDSHPEWQLLAPVLARLTRQERRPAVLVGPALEPFGTALASRGLDPALLLRIEADTADARQWACEQALRCAQPAAVLAWLPQARSEGLRRLQIAAHDHDKLLFVFRPLQARVHSSPAPLRIAVAAYSGQAGGLQLHLLKRRGPPLDKPLLLPSHPDRLLDALGAGRRLAARRHRDSLMVQRITPAQHALARPAPASLGR